MRNSASNGSLTVHIVAGSHSALLGFDLKPSPNQKKPVGLLGFGIERTDHETGEMRPLRGPTTFEETVSVTSNYSILDHCIQDFRWGDYTLKPGRSYTYEVFPVTGTPKNLLRGKSVKVTIQAESEEEQVHSVYFNRGTSAMSAYSRRFGSIPKEDLDKAIKKANFLHQPPELLTLADQAAAWLSRGLCEALVAFIDQAKDETFAIRACLYEFAYRPVFDALLAAIERGVDVRLVVDDLAGESGPAGPNYKALKKTRKTEVLWYNYMVHRRARGISISHNKFFILAKKNGDELEPSQVWTGSTNITAGGIFGHSNVGHQVRDPEVAAIYYQYWKAISTDPGRSGATGFQVFNDTVFPYPGVNAAHAKHEVIFSPRGKDPKQHSLTYYKDLATRAKGAVFLTAAFGLSDEMSDGLSMNSKRFLRFVLLDKKGQKYENFIRVKRNRDTRVALGDTIEEGELWDWHEEQLTGLNANVPYVHTKYMIIDPLGSTPIVITGSANFSKPSTESNDENMMVIRGNTRVADIYLCEFMRLFEHFAFRNEVDAQRKAELKALQQTDRYATIDDIPPCQRYLDSTDAWTEPHYQYGSIAEKERLYYSGQGPT